MSDLTDFYAERGALGFSAQNADDKPHLTYYLAERGLSFVWDGVTPYVDVCIGGYGEPVYHRIEIDRSFLRLVHETLTGPAVLTAFGEICDRWASANPMVSEADLIARTEGRS